MKIVALLPPHRTYVEPFAGGLSVLLAKEPEGVSEVVNDLCGDLTNFWWVLQNVDTWRDFRRIVEAVPFSEAEFFVAKRATVFGSDVDRAVNFFVLCRQSLAGRMRSFAPISTSRTRRGMNEQASAWLSAVEGLSAVHERLKRVVVLNRDAVDVIRQFDVDDCVQYLDPPYCPTTRASPAVYEYEMTEGQHAALLSAVKATTKARFAISGYRCDLYDAELAGWRRVDFDVANHAAGGDRKRRAVESVWVNY